MDLFTSYTLQETLVLNPQLTYHSNEEFALYGYCIPVFAALSLVANSLVIRTLGFRRPHGEQPPNLSSLDLFLQHLAIYDIAVAGLRCVHFMVKKDHDMIFTCHHVLFTSYFTFTAWKGKKSLKFNGPFQHFYNTNI